MSTPPLPVHRHRPHDRTQLHRTGYRPPRGRGADRGRASDLAWVEVLEGVERMFRCGQDARRRRAGYPTRSRGSPGQRRPSASMSRCLPQVDHEPAHGTWICGSARSSMVGKSPTQRGADLAIRPPFLRLINSDQ